jgi:hypothetical protein
LYVCVNIIAIEKLKNFEMNRRVYRIPIGIIPASLGIAYVLHYRKDSSLNHLIFQQNSIQNVQNNQSIKHYAISFLKFPLSMCDDDNKSSASALSVNKDVEDEKDEDWEAKRQSCGFCKRFLESPCAEEFKSWLRCIHRSKSAGLDYVQECRSVSSVLLGCSKAHPELFSVLEGGQTRDKQEEEDDEFDNDEDDDHEDAEGTGSLTIDDDDDDDSRER